MTTLKCGHPAEYLAWKVDGPATWKECHLCNGQPLMVRRRAADLCGVAIEPTPEEQAFAADIVDNADPPSLSRFADWLEEAGDPRGELIRVECELRVMGAKIVAGVLSNLQNVTQERLKLAEDLTRRRSALRQSLGYDRQTCPECRGMGDTGRIGAPAFRRCPRCGGTGRA